jgi:hypothetical protein
MKKYILTITYNEDDDTVESIEEQILNKMPPGEPPTMEISCREPNFFEQAEKMSFDDQNMLFRAAAECGGVMGDA